MKTIIGAIAALVGLNYFFPSLFASFVPASPNQAGTGLPTSATGITSSLNLRDALLSKSGLLPSGLLTFDQWNFYFQQVRGIYAMPKGLVDSNIKMTVDEWLQIAQTNEATGMNGLGGISVGVPFEFALARRVITNSGERTTMNRIN